MGLKKRNKFNAEFNMSSLTDIIFLLLIFFMLTSSLTSPNSKNIDRPKSNSTTPSPQNVALSIDEEGLYYIDNTLIPTNELETRLAIEIEKERQKKANKAIQSEVTVVLNVAAEEKTGTIVKVMKLSNKLGVRLILATDPNS